MKKPKKPSVNRRYVFVNNRGDTMSLNGRMTLGDLFKLGVTKVGFANPKDPIRDGEWRDSGR